MEKKKGPAVSLTAPCMMSWAGAVLSAGVIVLVQAIKTTDDSRMKNIFFMELKFEIISNRGYHFEQSGLKDLGLHRIIRIFLEGNRIRVGLAIGIVDGEGPAALEFGRLFGDHRSAQIQPVIGRHAIGIPRRIVIHRDAIYG